MKYTLIIITLIIVIATSCTKDKSSSTATGYTCTCNIYWNAGAKDSVMTFPYGNIDQGTATSSCNDELRALQAKYGYGTGPSNGQWVICNL